MFFTPFFLVVPRYMNLHTQYPRSLKERLGLYVHLPRIIDKCRAKLSGTLGEYLFPCPLDKQFLEFAQITEDALLAAVQDRSDQEVLEWISVNGKPHSDQEIQEWNEMMLQKGPDTEEKWGYFKKIRETIDPSRDDITTWADLLDLEEGREVPVRTTTSTKV